MSLSLQILRFNYKTCEQKKFIHNVDVRVCEVSIDEYYVTFTYA